MSKRKKIILLSQEVHEDLRTLTRKLEALQDCVIDAVGGLPYDEQSRGHEEGGALDVVINMHASFGEASVNIQRGLADLYELTETLRRCAIIKKQAEV